MVRYLPTYSSPVLRLTFTVVPFYVPSPHFGSVCVTSPPSSLFTFGLCLRAGAAGSPPTSQFPLLLHTTFVPHRATHLHYPATTARRFHYAHALPPPPPQTEFYWLVETPSMVPRPLIAPDSDYIYPTTIGSPDSLDWTDYSVGYLPLLRPAGSQRYSPPRHRAWRARAG